MCSSDLLGVPAHQHGISCPDVTLCASLCSHARAYGLRPNSLQNTLDRRHAPIIMGLRHPRPSRIPSRVPSFRSRAGLPSPALCAALVRPCEWNCARPRAPLRFSRRDAVPAIIYFVFDPLLRRGLIQRFVIFFPSLFFSNGSLIQFSARPTMPANPMHC